MKDMIIKVYRIDRRCKSGEKLIHRDTYTGLKGSEYMDKIEAWTQSYPPTKYRIEYTPATKTVKNLMSGLEVEVAWDCPRECDPSSELYWSM